MAEALSGIDAGPSSIASTFQASHSVNSPELRLKSALQKAVQGSYSLFLVARSSARLHAGFACALNGG
jgi:hypothetical protein